MPTPRTKALVWVLLTGFSFVMLAFTIIFLRLNQTVSAAQALLMLVALFGLYVGFGILIGVYRLISRLN